MLSYLESLNLGNFEAVGDDAGVQTLRDEAIGLLEKLTDQQHDGGGTVTANVVLGGGGTGNHDGSRVLYLHFAEKNVAILCELDL